MIRIWPSTLHRCRFVEFNTRMLARVDASELVQG